MLVPLVPIPSIFQILVYNLRGNQYQRNNKDWHDFFKRHVTNIRQRKSRVFPLPFENGVNRPLLYKIKAKNISFKGSIGKDESHLLYNR